MRAQILVRFFCDELSVLFILLSNFFRQLSKNFCVFVHSLRTRLKGADNWLHGVNPEYDVSVEAISAKTMFTYIVYGEEVRRRQLSLTDETHFAGNHFFLFSFIFVRNFQPLNGLLTDNFGFLNEPFPLVFLLLRLLRRTHLRADLPLHCFSHSLRHPELRCNTHCLPDILLRFA